MKKTAMVIINPSSGGEKADTYREQIEKKLKTLFEEVVVKETDKQGDAEAFACFAAQNHYDAVFAMGGDGTVNEAINGLAEKEHRPLFGFIPLGTVNDLGRALHLSLDPEEAIEQLSFEHVTQLDIGKVNDRYFMNVIAVGTIPEAINDVDSEEKTKMGKMAYFVSGMKYLLKSDRYEFELLLDQQVEQVKSSLVLIGLTNSIGGFESLLPKAKVDDGFLHLVYLNDQSFLDMVKSVPELIKGVEITSANVTYRTFKQGEIALLSEGNLETNIDGDPGAELPIKVAVLPQHLTVFCGRKK
ncbi:diacylglycerol/lipid kinase family protein [Enterococcus camelliae]|uniref:Diacylglycerol/lipid kinase family protein n=1 Tax=Enterococcus camelliae TaxID=453959 RepID=A0ABW5TII6_9ENTE